jgi:Cytochrome b(C-terminal)/b6/petD
MSRYKLEKSDDARETPRRVALIRRESSARVMRPEDEAVVSAPNLLIRELVLFQVVVGVLAVLALVFNAPLEGIADPQHTPNPAKAPWYFLGLQELLHYFPPVVAGVILPGLVVLSVVVIPYFRVNWELQGFLTGATRMRLSFLSVVAVGGSGLLLLFHAWPVALCTMAVYLTILLAVLPITPRRFRSALVRVPLSDWIMTWFVMSATALTLIGVFFRGPGWAWVWPWLNGGVR